MTAHYSPRDLHTGRLETDAITKRLVHDESEEIATSSNDDRIDLTRDGDTISFGDAARDNEVDLGTGANVLFADDA